MYYNVSPDGSTYPISNYQKQPDKSYISKRENVGNKKTNALEF